MILNVCSDPDVLSAMRIVKITINIIKISVPIILIVKCMLDLVGAVSKGETKEVLKAMTSRIIAAVLIFFIPTFVDITFRLFDGEKVYYSCIEDATIEKISEANERMARSYLLLAKNTLNNSYYTSAKPYINKIKDEGTRNALNTEAEAIHDEIIEERNKKEAEYASKYTKAQLVDMDEQTVRNMSNEEFIEYVASLAIDVYHEYGGVLPSITIAQACLESSYGDSFEPTSHNLYGLIGYPDEKPLVSSTKKFETFYEATYYHCTYFTTFSGVYSGFLEKCAQKDAFGAADYLSAYASGESTYPGVIKEIINMYDLTKYDN